MRRALEAHLSQSLGLHSADRGPGGLLAAQKVNRTRCFERERTRKKVAKPSGLLGV